MVSGHLEIKKNYYYAVLNYKDGNGNRKRKWLSTGIPARKGNKRKAQAELAKLQAAFMTEFETDDYIDDQNVGDDMFPEMLYSDYLEKWLEITRVKIKVTTYSSYRNMAKANIIPYFSKKKIRLKDLKAQHIQAYYTKRLQEVKPNTVIHEHAVIFQSLKYAEKIELVPKNVAVQVDRPKKNDYQPVFLDAEELEKIFKAARGTRLELPIMIAAFYGLRRSEVIGLKWSAIDFDKNTITINHTVTTANPEGKYEEVAQDSAKTKSSLRTLPLVGNFKRYFQELKESQELNRQICDNSYNYDYIEYVFVDELGERMKPGYITGQFPKFLEKHGFRHMRFHDLRHCSASLLLANGVQMKQIQEWLGHSDFSTTANIYAHLDYSSKISSAEAMTNILELPDDSCFESKWKNC